MDKHFKHTVALLADYPHQWAVCGGWAIDLFMNQHTRDHKDLDITVKRSEQLHLQKYLLKTGWTLKKISKSEALDWAVGEYLELPIHNFWCARAELPEYYMECLFTEADESHYKFRRKQSIQRPLAKAFIKSDYGLDILAPEIVLLYKAKYSEDRPSAQHDFDLVLPKLNSEQRTWLKGALLAAYEDTHVWVAAL